MSARAETEGRYDELAEAVCETVDAMYADSYVAPDAETARRSRERLHRAIARMQDLAEYERRRPPAQSVGEGS